jgi:hypothetical protein
MSKALSVDLRERVVTENGPTASEPRRRSVRLLHGLNSRRI